jgi:hypothetical protein
MDASCLKIVIYDGVVYKPAFPKVPQTAASKCLRARSAADFFEDNHRLPVDCPHEKKAIIVGASEVPSME